jgi:hypothetical protein
MKNFFYLKALRRTIIQFLDIFNNIRIGKYDANGNVTKYVNVPVKLAGKDKTWMWLRDQKQEKITPMISAQMTGVTFSEERAAGRHEYVNTALDNNVLTRYLNPVPYDLDFSVGILGQYMVELDQILEQILAYFNPYVFIRIDIPEIGANYEVKVISQSSSLDFPVTMGEEDYRLLTWTLPFTIQTYLFRPAVDVSVIEKLFINFYTNEEVFGETVGTETAYTSGGEGNSYDESIFLEALGLDQDGATLYNYELFGNDN